MPRRRSNGSASDCDLLRPSPYHKIYFHLGRVTIAAETPCYRASVRNGEARAHFAWGDSSFKAVQDAESAPIMEGSRASADYFAIPSRGHGTG